jgi:hypothetical protein
MTERMGIGKADLLVELLAVLRPPRLERTQEGVHQMPCGGSRGVDSLGGEDEGGGERPFGERGGERMDEGVAGVEGQDDVSLVSQIAIFCWFLLPFGRWCRCWRQTADGLVPGRIEAESRDWPINIAGVLEVVLETKSKNST